MSIVTHRLSVLLLAAIVAAGLGACRQDEQSRPLTYEKGVYGGPKQPELTAEQKQRLRNRHRNQSGGGL